MSDAAASKENNSPCAWRCATTPRDTLVNLTDQAHTHECVRILPATWGNKRCPQSWPSRRYSNTISKNTRVVAVNTACRCRSGLVSKISTWKALYVHLLLNLEIGEHESRRIKETICAVGRIAMKNSPFAAICWKKQENNTCPTVLCQKSAARKLVR